MAIPTNQTQEPLTGDTIEASRVRDHANLGTAKRYIEGLDPSLAGTTLTILASPKWGVYVGGNLWRRAATEPNHTETLTDDAVNHVYFAPNGNIEVNTSGTPADAGSVKLYTITVTSGTPVLTSDDRSTLFDFSDGATFAGPVSAPGEKVSGDNAEMSGTDPEYVLTDGATKRKIRLIGSTGALQVLDESDTVLTEDLSNIGTTVESKTANFTAEAAVLYLANHATPATRIIATLPESPTTGDIVTFVGGANTAGFRVKENATSTEAIKFFTSTTAGSGSDYWQCDAAFQALRVIYDGAQWVVSFHVGDFQNTALDAEGDFVKADGSVAFTADQSFGGNKATNLADPTADSHAVPKGFADSNYRKIIQHGVGKWSGKGSTTTQHYGGIAGPVIEVGTIGGADSIFPSAATLVRVYLYVDNNSLDGTGVVHFRVFKNGVEVVDIQITAATGTGNVDSGVLAVAFAAGDRVTVGVHATGATGGSATIAAHSTLWEVA